MKNQKKDSKFTRAIDNIKKRNNIQSIIFEINREVGVLEQLIFMIKESRTHSEEAKKILVAQYEERLKETEDRLTRFIGYYYEVPSFMETILNLQNLKDR